MASRIAQPINHNIITVVIIKQMSVMQFAKYLCRVRDSKYKYCFDIIEIKL